MDLKQIGYFLYMEEQEEKQKQQKVNVEKNINLAGEQTATKEDDHLKILRS